MLSLIFCAGQRLTALAAAAAHVESGAGPVPGWQRHQPADEQHAQQAGGSRLYHRQQWGTIPKPS